MAGAMLNSSSMALREDSSTPRASWSPLTELLLTDAQLEVARALCKRQLALWGRLETNESGGLGLTDVRDKS